MMDPFTAISIAVQCADAIHRIVECIREASCVNDNLSKFSELLDRHHKILETYNPDTEQYHGVFEQYLDLLDRIQNCVNDVKKRNWPIKFIRGKDFNNTLKEYKTELFEVMNEFQLYELLNGHNILAQIKEQTREVSSEVKKVREETIDMNELMLLAHHFEMPRETVERGDRMKVVKRMYWSEPVALMQVFENDTHAQGGGLNKDTIRQLKIWRICSKHPSMLKVFGLVRLNGNTYFVSEWCENGTLQDYLKTYKSVPWSIKFRLARQVAKALEFLHNSDVYHKDVGSHTVFVSDTVDAKLAGFEHSRFASDTTRIPLNTLEAMRRRAPEYSPKAQYNDKCDVYSFGMLMWEIAMQKVAFSEITTFEDLANYRKQHHRPDIPGNIDPDFKQLLEDVLVEEPADRPKMTTISERLVKSETRMARKADTQAYEDSEHPGEASSGESA